MWLELYKDQRGRRALDDTKEVMLFSLIRVLCFLPSHLGDAQRHQPASSLPGGMFMLELRGYN